MNIISRDIRIFRYFPSRYSKENTIQMSLLSYNLKNIKNNRTNQLLIHRALANAWLFSNSFLVNKGVKHVRHAECSISSKISLLLHFTIEIAQRVKIKHACHLAA